MKHDYCARCGADAKESRELRAGCEAGYGNWTGNHIWTWNEGDSIVPHMERKERVEAGRVREEKGGK